MLAKLQARLKELTGEIDAITAKDDLSAEDLATLEAKTAEIEDDPGRLAEVLELVDAAPGRFFGYVHFSATHHPYPPDGRDPDYMEQFGFAYDEEARQQAGADFTTPDVKNAILQGDLRLEPDDERFLHLVYEATLRHVDRDLFGALIEGLKKRGVYESTLIVLTADHGEELYDLEGYAHQVLFSTRRYKQCGARFQAAQAIEHG